MAAAARGLVTMLRAAAAMALAVILAATMAVDAAATSPAFPPRLSACFGAHGVRFGSLSAWLCERKLGGDPSGGLYFSPSVDDGLGDANPSGQMVWMKLHAADSNFYVWENYAQPWGGSSVRANGRIVAIDEGPAGQCIVDFPSWTAAPTMCTPVTNGGHVGAERTMTAVEQQSVAEYIANARAAIPLEYR